MNRINDILRGAGSLRKWIAASILITLFSCNNERDEPSKRITLWRKDKQPYGTYIAYEGLSYLFPNAEISVNRKGINTLSEKEGKKAFIFIGHQADLEVSDVNALLNFVGEGNHVFLSAFYFSDTLLHTLDVKLGRTPETLIKDTLQVSVYQPVSKDPMSYTYPGAAYDMWVDSLDKKYATVLGRDAKGHPDLIKFSYKGGGSLFLHFAPLAFSNYFLMHKDNKTYYDNVFSYIPESVSEVIWDESFRYNNNKRNNFSSLGFILNQRSLAMAFWLLLLLFCLIYFFESKRRQRIVPVIAGLRNTSLDFVKTVGRLYYQRRDNQNLAAKMTTYFQDHIRTKYNIPVHLSDPEFVDRLAYRTGMNKESLRLLIGDLVLMQQNSGVSDTDLLELNKKLEEFYKQA